MVWATCGQRVRHWIQPQVKVPYNVVLSGPSFRDLVGHREPARSLAIHHLVQRVSRVLSIGKSSGSGDARRERDAAKVELLGNVGGHAITVHQEGGLPASFHAD